MVNFGIMLLKDPESGPVMEGTGGIRKVRFPLQNRGKSGSIRVCYTDFAEYEVIYLITVFEKKDQENLTDDEKNVLKKLIKALKEGLEEAIDYEKGTGKAAVKTYMIMPVKEYSGPEIRDIRKKAGMTQSVFASYMGVSIKTVEAWEGGRTHPTGPVFRLLAVLSESEEMKYIVAK